MNVIVICGNLGNDAQEKTNNNGTKYWILSVATNESYKDKDGNRQKITTWHTCLLYGNYDNLVPYLRKGQSVNIRGLQRHDKYEKDNQTQYYSYVKIQELSLAGSKQEDRPQPAPGPEVEQQAQNTAPEQQAAPQGTAPPPTQTDDLPF